MNAAVRTVGESAALQVDACRRPVSRAVATTCPGVKVRPGTCLHERTVHRRRGVLTRDVFQTFKEPTMKLTTLLNHSVFATLLLSASVSAIATPPSLPQPDWHPYVNAASTSAPLLAEVDVTRASEPTAAANPAQDTGTVVSAGAAAHGKTREQVRTELLQAEEAGSIPIGNVRYPASSDLMARNRMQFQQAEKWWRARGQLNASGQ
jgi:hypothetical protein